MRLQLRKPCIHDLYDDHGGDSPDYPFCPGGEFPDPAGYLEYGEYIPYDIFWDNTPFAARTDQVVALYAEEGT